jgi:glycosyltransferase involved in cell wall biosynthesis
MARVSVLIPARNEPYLNRTIAEVFDKAAGDVECIVTLDGAPETEPLPQDRRLIVIRNHAAQGLGAVTWTMANVATGKYLFKLDAHCALAEGYDAALQADCADNWMVIPARYQLKDETWTRGYGPIHYLYLTYPWLCEPQFGAGLHGKKWVGENGLAGSYFWPEKAWAERAPLDDVMAFQGSAYFVPRAYFLAIGGLDRRYWLHQEATTLGMKVWLSGGRLVRNKATWYAHLHKGSRHGRGYFVSKSYSQRMNIDSADYWMNDRWPDKVRGIHWFVAHFWPIPGWPEDWDNPKYQQEFVYPTSDKGE